MTLKSIFHGKTVYLSGPMTNIPGFNYPKFYEWELFLTTLGAKVHNPARIVDELCQASRDIFSENLNLNSLIKCSEKRKWVEYMSHVSPYVGSADILVQLEDWNDSFGARCELIWAEKFNLNVVSECYINTIQNG